MAPKSGLTTAARHNLILTHLRATRTCHTIKDLEKMLPSVASINGMHVKDYVQALTDDGRIHVEKIGSGNWYWTWAGEEKKSREQVRDGLGKEIDKIQKVVRELEVRIQEEKQQQGCAEEEEKERGGLVVKKEMMEKEVKGLKDEMDGYVQGDGGAAMEKKEADIEKWKAEAGMWTDNIYVLEEYLKKLAGGDREVVDFVRRECYGDEYIEGEGLRELEL